MADVGPEADPVLDGVARFAQGRPGWAEAGAAIVGGCCEVGPPHIAALRDRLAAAGYTTVASLDSGH